MRRPCIRCGTPSEGSYCARHAALELAHRQPYRAAYGSAVYRRARRERFRIAGDRCEAIVDGARCPAPAVEAHHVVPLSSSSSLAEALALCDVGNLRAVCFRHNPRGGRVAV